MKPVFKALGLASALALAASGALAQGYPTKPIRFVTGNLPGGGTDALARIVGPKLGERLGQTVIVENRPGAEGIIASEYVAKSAADGYTLLVGADSQMVLNVGLHAKLPYDPVADFAPITRISAAPLMIAVHPSLPVASIKELVALAKSKPGELFYASGAAVFRVTTEFFKAQTGIDIVPVPYKGAAPAVAALIAGDVQIAVVSIGPLLPQLRAGKVRGLAVASLTRIPLLPDTPTMEESGLPGFQAVPWTGLFAPAATPRAVIDLLNSEVNAVLNLNEIKDAFAARAVLLGGTTPEEMTALLKADLAKWPKLLKELQVRSGERR
ncbi:MAG: tripartite tricarboxylate transporter substrate binding protein [Betaproteobacteria bacterium]|nr:tripartite tricarboxylate transporter substrate binding protein [Betaproteobacteria bacterium]MBI2958979.1 tripartite tricarboxylate transporter substrate binding protein [Betaproteobacteria bacterium]